MASEALAPDERRWFAASLVLALGGIAVAGYLTIAHYNQGVLVCSSTIGNCHTVQASVYATVGSIPIALFGLGMYIVLAALAWLRWRRPDLAWPATLAAFAIAFGGVLVSAYLTYLELAVIHAICQWCVISALLAVGLLLVEIKSLSALL
ncbi:MAG TPA: vitamin K epoxide reductase family protein [Thermomicrobiales bacterium]|nr:vitamin K epoxide reductase family protein [Thermomicrobiales bacterium]